MRKTHEFALKSSLFAVALLASVWSNADFWKFTRPFNEAPSETISTLVVIGNYAEPRILAELIQRETRQPILLLPAKGKDGIYFMPPQKRNAAPAMKIPVDELPNFVNLLGPKQIMILGDSRYVNKELTDRITPNRTVVAINNQEWEAVAQSVGRLLNLTNLADDFKKLLAQFRDENQYRRVKYNSKGQPIAPVAEPPKMTEMPAPIAEPPPPVPAIKEDIQIIDATPQK